MLFMYKEGHICIGVITKFARHSILHAMSRWHNTSLPSILGCNTLTVQWYYSKQWGCPGKWEL